jgi:anaerobic selenocysteine-containing dehydrogenase
MSEQIRTICTRDCPDSCGIVATVDGGRVVKLKGDPDHGITRGFLCRRGNRYLDRFNSPDRILHPLRRVDGAWRRISWDAALDLAAEKLDHHRARLGPLSVLGLTYSGIRGHVSKLLWRLFWRHFGGRTSTRGGLSVEAAFAAQYADFGAPATHAPEDLINAAGVCVWGKNLVVTRPHVWKLVRRAREQGAVLHVIDPVESATARKADRHYQIRPGSDAALAIGVARQLIERGAVDAEMIASHVIGFDAFCELVLSVSLDEVAGATDLPRQRIEELGELYAAVKPLATMFGLGPSYWRGGGATGRLIDALAALSGNIGVPGGGAHTDIDGGACLDYSALDGAPRARQREVLLPRLGQEILAADDPPIRAGLIAGANPAATAPDTGRVVTALAALDFLVVVEQFMTATAAQADLVLPCATFLEMEDLVTAYGHHWIGMAQEVVRPLGEVKTDVQILQGLADRLGFGSELAGEPRVWIRQLLGPLVDRGVTPERLERGAMPNPDAAAVPFADRRFATPSGKVELVDALPAAEPELGAGELHLVATKSLMMVNAQINDKDLVDEPCARAHPQTLGDLGLEDGQPVWVVSPTARVRVRLAAERSVRRDVLLFNPAAWRGDLQGVNQLREAVVADLGDAAAMHETVVTLEPC